ncbi:metal-dependent hydrolase [Luteimonas abyssi]|uniref:metal-dependent hydrolase n=1 Tax=Luteimonas abyssi TaxID=1247514 RepID=UPI000737CD87|nr:metal-dependent hydrolase [Luteimonas abyssi]
MDSLTQILLGASVAAAVVPARHRRAAMGAGAVLGTLPDLDSFPLMLLTDDPIALMTLHRGLTHSLFVLPLVAWAIWAWFRRRGGRVADAPRAWFWAIQLALVTHPLLDAFTVYGTQLLWPLTPPPVMWSSLFIIDPGYTVWLLLGVLVALWVGPKPLGRHALVVGLALSSAYIGWSLLAKTLVDREATRALTAMGYADAPRFSVPMPLNTLLWRVVAMTPDGYLIGDRSVVADRGPMRFQQHRSDVPALSAASDLPAVQRLQWFNRGFMRAQVVDGELVLSDLRMGLEPDYSFNFVVGREDGTGWQAVSPRQLPMARPRSEELSQMWTRIWHEPEVETPGPEVDAHAAP